MAPTKTDSKKIELPTEEEIRETFQTLGLLSATGPTGYAYISPWGPAAPARLFEVIRTTTSAPRGA
jgi:hypothetical protein